MIDLEVYKCSKWILIEVSEEVIEMYRLILQTNTLVYNGVYLKSQKRIQWVLLWKSRPGNWRYLGVLNQLWDADREFVSNLKSPQKQQMINRPTDRGEARTIMRRHGCVGTVHRGETTALTLLLIVTHR